MKLALVVLAVVLSGCVTTGAAASAPAWVRDDRPAPKLEGTSVLFVAGYLNELIPGYFDDNVKVVEALGGKTDRLFPTSEESIDEDAAAVASWVEKQPGPIWLVGHSKGGAAVLLTALRKPRLLLEGKVQAVVVLQGAVKGSPVADRYDSDLILGKKGMHALTQQASETLFKGALESLGTQVSAAERRALFSRVFYVRSRIDEAAVASELSMTHNFLKKFGPNDGLLLADAMKLDDGVDLGVLDSDHAGLVLSSFLTSSSPERRQQFTNNLCREVSNRLAKLSSSRPAP